MTSQTVGPHHFRKLFATVLLAVVFYIPGFSQPPPSERTITLPTAKSRSIIVEFREAPLFLQENQISAYSESFYQNRLSEFRNDLSRMKQIAGTEALQTASEENLYFKVFFGIRIDADSLVMHEIENLPYVRQIHPDFPVEAHLSGSINHLQVPVVWQTYQTKGEGVKVAVVDSGIDYTHPAFGGGFGAGFRVVDGYDFVDNDFDPMDENGHGTHVAGIIAANSPDMMGVAPDALLYAYRVLDKDGRGRTSDIIAAIERLVDPNGDGDPADRVDIANLSLGSNFGNPLDASSKAVDNATQLGVLFVISAGNSGYVQDSGSNAHFTANGSLTVGSPGTARLALTVGATDLQDRLAPFSSKGPVGTTFEMKPDILAPGVSITSAFPGGGSKSLSGTSMAAPHIAGIAALLKAVNPEWGPMELKSAITGSANNLNFPVWHQGSGLVNPVKALQQQTLTFPTQLSFGMADVFMSNWSKEISIQVTNYGNEFNTYQIIGTETQLGVSLTVNTPAFTLSPGETKTLSFQLSVNNQILPPASEDIKVYGGLVRIQSPNNEALLPWSFSTSPTIRLSFSKPWAQFLMGSNEAYLPGWMSSKQVPVFWPTSDKAEIYAQPAGSYAIIAYFPNSTETTEVILKEQMLFNGIASEFKINHAEATFPLSFQGVDEFGNEISSYSTSYKYLSIRMPFRWMVQTIPTTGNSFRVNPASQNFSIYGAETGIETAGEPRIVIASYASRQGISDSFSFTNSPETMLSFPMSFKVRHDHSYQDFIVLNGFYESSEESDFKHSEYAYQIRLSVLDKTARLNYVVTNQSLDEIFNASRIYQAEETEAGLFRVDLETYPLTVVEGNLISNLPIYRDVTHGKFSPGQNVSFGISPVFPLPRTFFNAFGEGSLIFTPIVRGSLNEVRWLDHDTSMFRVYSQSGVLLKQGSFLEIDRNLTIPPQKIRFEVETKSHRIVNQPAISRFTSHVDLRSPQANSPWFFSVSVRNEDQIPVEHVNPGSKVSLLFSAAEVNLIEHLPVDQSKTSVEWRYFGTSDSWKTAPFTYSESPEGSLFVADLSASTAVDSTAIEVWLKVFDRHGNKSELWLSPVFAVGNWVGGEGTSVDPIENELPVTLTLHANFPNPFNPSTTIPFDLPQNGYVRLQVFDITGKLVATLIDAEYPAGQHNALFNAQGLSSGVYLSRLTFFGSTLTRKMMILK